MAANVVFGACQWGMLVVLAKFGTPEQVGQFALGVAIAAPPYMFANLHLREVLATDAERRFAFGHYLGLRVLTTVVAFVAIVILAVVTGYQGFTLAAIILVAFAKGFDHVSDMFHGLLQQHERMDRVARSLLMKGPLSLVALGVGFALTDSVAGAALGLVVVSAIMLVLYDARSTMWLVRVHATDARLPETRPLPADLRARWVGAAMRRLAWIAFPLAVVMMLISLTTNIPRYVIERQLGDGALGIFAALAVLMLAAQTAVAALGQSASPRLSRLYAGGDLQGFRALLSTLLAVAFGLGIVGVVVAVFGGRQLLTILYQPEYAEHADVLVWLMIAAGVAYVGGILGFGLMAARRFWDQLPWCAVAALTCGLASVLLVSRMGLRGAALALLTAATTQTTGAAMILHARIRSPVTSVPDRIPQ